ncbi:response regulator [Ideonella sp. BN130291]|uniref:response regulator n=1 Tax=Ideonella sp. BN130291 TaxID=3112940 RepID=UPI002E263891|nr:response regulator [Ideonella sp. BN130291]
MRVLVADDDAVSRLAVQELFAGQPHTEVVAVDSGAAAWDVLRADPCFDLACLDLRMPAPDGLALAERMRSLPELEQMPIVLVTSASDRHTVVAAGRLQLQGFLVKPVNEDAAERIHRVMAAFDATVLEPPALAIARLGVDADKHARYVEALCVQVQLLAQQAQRLSDAASVLAFQHKVGATRSAALALGARRIERLMSQAMQVADAAPERSVVLMTLALYWLQRVRADRA